MTLKEITKAIRDYMDASLCVNGESKVKLNQALQKLEGMSPTSISGTSTRLPFIRPESKTPPMTDRAALDILCGLLGGTVSLYEDAEQIKAAIEVAIQALEDMVLREDDLHG